MGELFVHGRPVETVFDLLGRRENDMTFALGWGYASSDSLAQWTFERSGYGKPTGDLVIRLQESASTGGYTDIELIDPGRVHLIIEAKRGWEPPTDQQLTLYERRLNASNAPSGALVILTQRGAESVMADAVDRGTFAYPRRVLSWSEVAMAA